VVDDRSERADRPAHASAWYQLGGIETGVIDNVVDDVKGRGVVAVLRAVLDAVDRDAESRVAARRPSFRFSAAQGVPTRGAHLICCRQIGIIHVKERLGGMLHSELQRDFTPVVGGVDPIRPYGRGQLRPVVVCILVTLYMNTMVRGRWALVGMAA